MAKDTFYFSHDYNTRTDIKIKKLIQKHGYVGYGIFWAIVEDLYNNANALPADYISIAYDLREDEKLIISVINDFDLFIIEDNIISSESVERRLILRDAKSDSARKAALARWEKEREKKRLKDANALQTECKCNAIKESKEKESKEKESKLNDINSNNNTDTITTNDKKEKNTKKEKKYMPTESEQQMFDQARKFYLGSKRGLQTELNNFVKKYPTEWRNILPLLLPAILREKVDKEQKLKDNGFNQQWKNFSTWINGRCWEIEYPNVSEKEVNELGISVTTNESGEQKVEVKQDRSSFPLYSSMKVMPHVYPEGTESRCGYYVIKNKECVRTKKY